MIRKALANHSLTFVHAWVQAHEVGVILKHKHSSVSSEVYRDAVNAGNTVIFCWAANWTVK